MDDWPKPNSAGVYVTKQCESTKFSGRHSNASIEIIQVGDNDWRMSTHYHAGTFGSSYCPHVTGKRYSSRDDAFFAGVAEIKSGVTHYMRRPDFSENKTSMRGAQDILDWCETFKQMALF